MLKENIDYEYLVEANKGREAERVGEVLNLMLDVICFQREYTRVNGESCPKEAVKY